MQDEKTYKIFWNNHYPDFWKWHKLFCEKLDITRDVTLNYWTQIKLSGDKLESFQKAVKSGMILYITKV